MWVSGTNIKNSNTIQSPISSVIGVRNERVEAAACERALSLLVCVNHNLLRVDHNCRLRCAAGIGWRIYGESSPLFVKKTTPLWKIEVGERAPGRTQLALKNGPDRAQPSANCESACARALILRRAHTCKLAALCCCRHPQTRLRLSFAG